MMRSAMQEDRHIDRRNDAQALEERLIPLIAAAVERHAPAGNAELRSSLAQMGERVETLNAATRVAMERMTEAITTLQTNQGSPPVAVADNQESPPMATSSNAHTSNYPCPTRVRAAGGLIHTFWDCPRKLEVDNAVQKKMRD